MREVIRIPGITNVNEKPVEFTHLMTPVGWGEVSRKDIIKKSQSIIYLGSCDTEGDMFSVTGGGLICVFKGHLNSGKY